MHWSPVQHNVQWTLPHTLSIPPCSRGDEDVDVLCLQACLAQQTLHGTGHGHLALLHGSDEVSARLVQAHICGKNGRGRVGFR